MWPLNAPAQTVLRLPGATSVPWAVFDADWYRASYPDHTVHLVGASADAVLEFYFEAGQQLGHSPNILFDEAWHRQAYPGIADLVEAGQFPSAFDAWCRGGCCERSPHWLFDEPEYRRRNPDLTDAFLARNGLVNGYDHYLWRGNAEGRIGHPLFDPVVYSAALDPAAANEAVADGPFWHCLRRLHRREAEVRTSVYFDPAWYLHRYPAVSEEIVRGTWRWALEHYLCNATPTRFDPVPAFSETYYLARYDDVREMVRRGDIPNGFAHFLRQGIAELRAPGELVDLAWYARQETVRRDLDQGLAADAFAHWVTFGQPGDLPPAPPIEAPVAEVAARTLFRRRARTMSVLHARTKLNFAAGGVPALSVIMVLHNQFELTMLALGSLRENYPGDIDLVLIDSGSTDATTDIQRFVFGATFFRFDTNIGYLLGCNAALQFVTGDAVLYLNNHAELAPGAIAAALQRLDSDPRTGAVGGMILRSDGLVQEAGNIIYCDGSAHRYGRDLSPLAPEVNFARDVEFCSGVFLMARRSLLNDLGGFDEAFTGPCYEDADLCLRIRQADFRVVYDPAVIVHHLEEDDGASGGGESEAEIGRAPKVFAEKHAAYLSGRPQRDAQRQVFDRMADTQSKRVLFVEDTVPLRMIGSGFVRSNDIVREMAAAGYAVTVYPLNGCAFDVASVYADMPAGVEVMHDYSAEQFQGFLTLRRGYFDAIWVARTHNLATVRTALEQVELESDAREPVAGYQGRVPEIVLDTEAIASLREAGQAALAGTPFDFGAAIGRELRDAAFCQTIVAINDVEAAILRKMGYPNAALIGHMREPRPTPLPFAQRAGMLFVGAIHRTDSPNYDSLCWFVDEVLPLIERELAWETRLTVVGYTGAEVSLDRFRDHPRVTLRGPVSDLEPLYDQHRVFVAPTRFAAGMPYKIHEAASFGLPVVATDLLRRQLGWEDGQELLAAEANDPGNFARHVVALQRDAERWQRLRDAALRRLKRDNNRADYVAAIRDVLGPPIGPG